MPKKKIAEFKVERLEILDENGNVDKALEPKIPNDDLKKLYKVMVLTRRFDDKCLSLQRQGRIGTYAQNKGQEAVSLGAAYALKKEDWIVPAFREHAGMHLFGVPLKNLILYWAGTEECNIFPQGVNVLPICIPIASQILHAVGIAMASDIKKEKRVAMTFFGDGATSEGDFHEGLNFAGVFKSPVVFICQNNQWAISIPRSKQTASETLAQKAIAHGIEGLQVDGNDILAVYAAAKKAVDKARNGLGPTLIECDTYRMGAHTTADDPKKYRSEEEAKKWEKKDPLIRFQKYLKNKGLWTEQFEKNVQEESDNEIKKAVEEYESMRFSPNDMFRYMYKEQPLNLKEQEEYFNSLRGNE